MKPERPINEYATSAWLAEEAIDAAKRGEPWRDTDKPPRYPWRKLRPLDTRREHSP